MSWLYTTLVEEWGEWLGNGGGAQMDDQVRKAPHTICLKKMIIKETKIKSQLF